MTDIEKQIAEAAQTHKSTAILSDPEHITEPLQIVTFVISLFHAYIDTSITEYEKNYHLSKLEFAKMLINFTDPPSLAVIINNGDYFVYWEQARFKMGMWFEIFKNLNRKQADANETYFIWLQKKLAGTNNFDKLSVEQRQTVVLRLTIINMFEALDQKYREFQFALVEAESNAILNLRNPVAKPITIEETKVLQDQEWIKRMRIFLNMMQKPAEAVTLNNLLKNVSSFIADVLVPNIPMFTAAPFPIGPQVGAVNRNERTIQFRTFANTPAPTTAPSRTTAAAPILTPETDSANANRLNKETHELENNSVIAHYKQIMEDFGKQMLELFRSFNFPPIFAFDNAPKFTAEWEGYILLAYNSFNMLAKQRYTHLAKNGSAGGIRAAPRWTLDQIYADPEAAALFAEFVGYKKSIPQNTIAPAPNVQRTNATYHYALNNMSLRFISLYDYMVDKEVSSNRDRRKFLNQYAPKK